MKNPLRKTTSSRPSRRHAAGRPRRLRGESLENRVVMAAAIDLTLDGWLVIEGDSNDNEISVSVSDRGQRLRVEVDGRTADFAASQVDALWVRAGAGNDSVDLDASVTIPSRLDGGSGNDRLQGGSGPDLIEGGAGRDQINGGGASDILFGGLGDDQLFGGDGDDYVVGGSGNDRIGGGAGNDWLFGDATNEYPEGAVDPVAYASEFADTNGGHDTISGGDGRDVMFGGRGNDSLTGGAGRDYFEGGAGIDQIHARDGVADLIVTDGFDRLMVDDADRIAIF